MKNIKYFKEFYKGLSSLIIVDLSNGEYHSFYGTTSPTLHNDWYGYISWFNPTLIELTADEFQTAMIELKK